MNAEATFENQEFGVVINTPLPLRKKSPKKAGKKKVIVLAGPTAVGKTKHSIALAKEIGGEIISADSMQVYRGMDIGTAKVMEEEREGVVHHLIDIRNLDESFNVMEFYLEACRSLQDIFSRGKVPVVVGGTGFYIHALIYGPPQGPPSVPELRKQLEEEVEKKGAESLYEQLRRLDLEYAKTITEADRHKIIRALEIISLTSKKVSEFPKMQRKEIPFDFRCWFLYMEKESLYPYIEMRCDQMIAAGFIDEVRHLDAKGLRKNISTSQAIGYKQCLEFIDSSGSSEDFEHFVAAFKRASRRYAKRQFTWFRKEPLFRWLRVDQSSIQPSIDTIIQDYELSF